MSHGEMIHRLLFYRDDEYLIEIARQLAKELNGKGCICGLCQDLMKSL